MELPPVPAPQPTCFHSYASRIGSKKWFFLILKRLLQQLFVSIHTLHELEARLKKAWKYNPGCLGVSIHTLHELEARLAAELKQIDRDLVSIHTLHELEARNETT